MWLSASLVVCLTLMVVGLMEARRYRGRIEDLPECTRTPEVRQRHTLICPEHAYCGSVWDTVRDWYNGTACRDRRITYNCMCPGHYRCPVFNDDHVIYINTKQSKYLCEPKCSLGRCSTRARASEEMVQNSPDFDYNNYFKINCRCPGHDAPMQTRRGRLLRATSYYRLAFNFTQGIVSAQYVCSRTRNDGNLRIVQTPDPCN